MHSFWRVQIRYRLARALIHVGLFVWPPGRAKAEIMELLWEWRWRVEDELAANKAPSRS